MQLIISIMLGNDTMRTGEDVADALRKLAKLIHHPAELTTEDSGAIYDNNGNRVGAFHVQRDLAIGGK